MERANKGIVLEFYTSLLTSAIFYINKWTSAQDFTAYHISELEQQGLGEETSSLDCYTGTIGK